MNDITHDDEISLADVLAFLQDAWKTILGVGIAGGLASGVTVSAPTTVAVPEKLPPPTDNADAVAV